MLYSFVKLEWTLPLRASRSSNSTRITEHKDLATRSDFSTSGLAWGRGCFYTTDAQRVNEIRDKAELTTEEALARKKTWLVLHPLTFCTVPNFPAVCFTRRRAADFNGRITLPSEVRRKYIKSDATKGKNVSFAAGRKRARAKHTRSASHSWFFLNVSIRHEGGMEPEPMHMV